MKPDNIPTALPHRRWLAHWQPVLQCSPVALLRSAFWLLMLVGHMPGLIRSASPLWSSHLAFNPVAATGFTLACTLFVLKILDVSWLRFRTDRKTVFSLTLAVALVHANLMRFASDAGEEFPTPLIVSNILLASNLSSVRRLLKRSLDWAGQLLPACRRDFLNRIGAVVTFAQLASLRFSLRSCSGRAPPLPI